MYHLNLHTVLIELDHWKATKYKQFKGIVAQRRIVSPTCYSHFLCVTLAMTILYSKSDERRQHYVEYARALLELFVSQSKDEYGEIFTVYCVYNLTQQMTLKGTIVD